MKRIGCLLVIGIIAVIFGTMLYAYFSLQATQPPGMDKASWAVQAYVEEGGVKIPTRYYYAESVKLEDGKAVMTTYWTFDGKRYNRVNGEKVVSPPFEILRRGK